MGLLNDMTDQQAMALAGIGQVFGGQPQNVAGILQYLAAAPDRAFDRQYKQAQMSNIESEIAARKLKLDQDARQQEWDRQFMGLGGGAPSAGAPSAGGVPGVAGGAAGGVPSAFTAQQISQQFGIPYEAVIADYRFNGGKKIAELIDSRTKPNIEIVNGVAVDKNRMLPGTSLPQMSPTGQGYQIMQDPNAPGGYRVIVPQGAAEAYGLFKGIDAGVTAQMTPEKVYNPQTGREEFRTRAQVLQASQPQPQAPASGPSRFAPEANVRGSFVGDPAQLMAQVQAMPDSQEKANILAAIREQAQRTPGFAQGAPFAAGPSEREKLSADVDRQAAMDRQKDIAEQRKAIVNAGFVAATNINRYQQIGRLLQDVDGGKLTPAGTEFASALNSVGIKVDKNLPNKEAAASFANQAALELRNPAGGAGMPGAMSDQDRQFLASMTPNMTQSAQGRKMVIDAYVAIQQRNMQVADFARKYEKKYGKLDNGFFDQLQQWSNSNPLFKAQ